MGTRSEWLWTPPTCKQATDVNEHLAKVSFLRELGAGRLAIEALPLEAWNIFVAVFTPANPLCCWRSGNLAGPSNWRASCACN